MEELLTIVVIGLISLVNVIPIYAQERYFDDEILLQSRTCICGRQHFYDNEYDECEADLKWHEKILQEELDRIEKEELSTVIYNDYGIRSCEWTDNNDWAECNTCGYFHNVDDLDLCALRAEGARKAEQLKLIREQQAIENAKRMDKKQRYNLFLEYAKTVSPENKNEIYYTFKEFVLGYENFPMNTSVDDLGTLYFLELAKQYCVYNEKNPVKMTLSREQQKQVLSDMLGLYTETLNYITYDGAFLSTRDKAVVDKLIEKFGK